VLTRPLTAAAASPVAPSPTAPASASSPLSVFRRPLADLRAPSAPGAPNAPSTGARNASLTYRPIGTSGEPYPEWVRDLRGKSGVYVIREISDGADPEIVYVGQSQTDNLYETLTRHFQTWRRFKGFWRGQFGSGHDPGMTYRRDRVDVAVRVTSAGEAIDEEARLIRTLRPRDNIIGQPPDLDEVPF
jgi:hypothetical protein